MNYSIFAAYREMEQLVARRAHNPKVVGSSPASATRKPFEGNFRGFFRLATFDVLILACSLSIEPMC